MEAPPERPNEVKERAKARKSTPECWIKRSSSVEMRASVTNGEISRYFTLVRLTCQKRPITVSSLTLFLARISEAWSSGGLSSMETGGRSSSDCSKRMLATKKNGSKAKIQNNLVIFFCSCSFKTVVFFFISSLLQRINVKHLCVVHRVSIR